jgi:hypothetical protein
MVTTGTTLKSSFRKAVISHFLSSGRVSELSPWVYLGDSNALGEYGFMFSNYVTICFSVAPYVKWEKWVINTRAGRALAFKRA